MIVRQNGEIIGNVGVGFLWGDFPGVEWDERGAGLTRRRIRGLSLADEAGQGPGSGFLLSRPRRTKRDQDGRPVTPTRTNAVPCCATNAI